MPLIGMLMVMSACSPAHAAGFAKDTPVLDVQDPALLAALECAASGSPR
jgi:hypothetical protein